MVRHVLQRMSVQIISVFTAFAVRHRLSVVMLFVILEKVVQLLNEKKPASIKVAALLLKPEAYKKSIPVDYVAFKIPNDFIVGYGLDYDGLGRNLKNIYKIEN